MLYVYRAYKSKTTLRIQAGIYLLFYTLITSLPLLAGVFLCFNEINTMIIYLIKFINLYFLYLVYFPALKY